MVDMCVSYEHRVHHLHRRGRASSGAALVARTNILVLVTGVNSYGAVAVVKPEAERSGAEVRIRKFCRSSKARALLTELSQARAA